MGRQHNGSGKKWWPFAYVHACTGKFFLWLPCLLRFPQAITPPPPPFLAAIMLPPLLERILLLLLLAGKQHVAKKGQIGSDGDSTKIHIMLLNLSLFSILL